MLNPDGLKCHEDLISLETYVQPGITMNNKSFTYIYVVKTYPSIDPIVAPPPPPDLINI